MELTYKLKVDFTDPIANANADPFKGYTADGWEKHFIDALKEKINELSWGIGVDITLLDSEGKSIY